MALLSVFEILILFLSIQFANAYCTANGRQCFYTLWYFWFALFWIIVFFVILIVRCVKKKNNATNRISNVTVVSGNIRPPVQKGPVPPPSYGQPSHQPPPYEAAVQNQRNYQPNQTAKTQGQAPYPPPGLNAYPPPGQNAYPPPGQNAYPPPGQNAYPPPGQNIPSPPGQNVYPPPPPANIYSPPNPSSSDPAYPPNQ